ncbi:MAG: SMP-30/gluconolactonase/LRE family protein [Planctomycetota bacterium]|nr:SMP-30/gluconolactonase/LRE family protein [Planctomycetota bacterium]
MLTTRISLALAFPLALSGCAGLMIGNPADVLETIGGVERLDRAINALVPMDSRLEVVADGFDWSEGPLWIPEDGGYVIFSDIPPNRIIKWQSGKGASLYLNQSGYLGSIPRFNHVAPDEPGSNGLLLDLEGRLVLCQHGNRQVARMDADLDAPRPNYVPIANAYQGKRLNSPNDAAYHENGDLYFTDPPYGLAGKMGDPDKQLDFQGVYRVRPDGRVTLLTRQLSRPNGIAFSPDFETLYVANSDSKHAVWMAFPVKSDGTLGHGRVLFDATTMVGKRRGVPDGLKVDQHGNLFATGPGGVLILSPDGRHLGTLLTGQATSNCGFGDDGSTLYITADRYLVRIRLSTRGAGF